MTGLEPQTSRKKKKISIFIDESGTLPDPKDKVIIIAAIGTNVSDQLLDVVKSVRKYLKTTKGTVGEIKFYRSGENTKIKFLKTLKNKQLEIFVLIVDKNNQKILDTPENFAILCWILLAECLLFYKKAIITNLIFDRHFYRKADQELFDKLLISLLGKELSTLHVDSKKDLRVNTADMIAGSVLWFKTGKSAKFYELIKDKIICETVINWKEAKRKFFGKKMSEPAQAPIQT